MSAAAVLNTLIRQIGRGAAQRPLTGEPGQQPNTTSKRRLPVLRCKVCRANYLTAIATPPPLIPCDRCGTRIRRTSPPLCVGCLALDRAERHRATELPHQHEAARFGSPELAAWCRDAEAIERAHAFAEAPPLGCRVLLLTGPTTAGKTSLVSAIVQHMAAAGRVKLLAWTTAKRLAEARSEHGLGAGEPPPMLRAMRATVAVIDDLGKELVLPPDKAGDVVTFLERRHAGERPLVPPGALDIITTELPVQLSAEEAKARAAAGEPVRDLVRCYDLSFVRRIAGALVGAGAVVRGSAVVINVRKG